MANLSEAAQNTTRGALDTQKAAEPAHMATSLWDRALRISVELWLHVLGAFDGQRNALPDPDTHGGQGSLATDLF
jgi:hypothetical protein